MADTTTLDEDLLAGLQQARKKKARNYCLIAKGPEVLKLIVQKKKIPAGVVQKAKAEVKGNNIIQGVVFGEGVWLSFEVLDSEPSIKPKKIKEYIADKTDLTVKPEWTVVSSLREVQEDDESEGPQAESAEAPPTAPPPPPETSASTAPPVPPPPPQGTAETAPPAPPPPDADSTKLLNELVGKMNKLSAAIQSAAAANPGRKADLIKPVAAFQSQVKAKDAAGAQKSLLEVAKVLKELSAAPPVAPPPPQSTAPQGQQPPVAPPPPQGQADQAGESESAEDEQEQQQEQEEQAARFRRDWAAARKNLRGAIDNVEAQLATFAEALLQSNDPNMEWVAEQGLTQLLGGLRASATTIDKSAAKSPEKIAKFARPALAELEKRLDSPQVKACDENKFGVKVSIRRTIEAALREMSQTLDQAS